MLDITHNLQTAASAAIQELYGQEVPPGGIPVQETRKDFEGDFTLVVFPLSRYRLGKPPEVAEAIGKALKESHPHVCDFNVVKGFLNLTLEDNFWREFLARYQKSDEVLFRTEGAGTTAVVEYCSPNTNKPLHLGHLRNIFLGYSLTEILKANGYETHPVCLYNDRGTAICKSMYAWEQQNRQDTPESTGKKGDVFVGDYYVEYAQMHRKEVEQMMATGATEEVAEKSVPTTTGINEMLVKWENEDEEVRRLWQKMNAYVYEAHRKTFERLGIRFEKYYYESDLYKEGKDIVEDGLKAGHFYQKEDGSVWVNLEAAGMDDKLLLRSNGTSLYITQDLATAEHKEKDFELQRSIYVVGNEQNHHFKVLFEVLKMLGKSYASNLFHLSYGIVELPDGRMKSREGTVVEADDLVEEVRSAVEVATSELGKIEGLEEAELEKLYDTLALGAIKFFLLKVDPKKGMVFDPEESLDLKGHTGPFVQYSYARMRGIERKAGDIAPFTIDTQAEESLHETERALLQRIFQYPNVLKDAADNYSPALIANYVYELAKDYNRFHRSCKVIQSDMPGTSSQRLALSSFAGRVIQAAMTLLGISVPDRM
ncbi:MAG: arginine--tRNA ligase [Bacteroidota bacterium]